MFREEGKLRATWPFLSRSSLASAKSVCQLVWVLIDGRMFSSLANICIPKLARLPSQLLQPAKEQRKRAGGKAEVQRGTVGE